MVHHIVNDLVPKHLFTMPSVRETCSVNTRQQDSLYVPKFNTNTGARSILIEGARLWNSLPVNIRSLQSTNNFKKHLLMYLFKEQFDNK